MSNFPEIDPPIFRGHPIGYAVAYHADDYTSFLQFDTYHEARDFMLWMLVENTKSDIFPIIQEHPVEYNLRDKWNQHYVGWSAVDAWNEQEDLDFIISPIYKAAKEQYED